MLLQDYGLLVPEQRQITDPLQPVGCEGGWLAAVKYLLHEVWGQKHQLHLA
jgi:hypothetical protein